MADGVVPVGADMMTGAAGRLRRRRHGGGRPDPHRRHRPRQAGGPGHRRLAGRPQHRAARPRHELATPEHLNTWYYADAPHAVRPRLEAARRTSTFDEVVGGLDESTALFEARRCMSCGNCFQCDNCFGVCPDNAVMKVDEAHGYRFDYDFCKGCGLCVQECPCGAIEMVPEEI